MGIQLRAHFENFLYNSEAEFDFRVTVKNGVVERFEPGQWTYIHFIKNFDFYWAKLKAMLLEKYSDVPLLEESIDVQRELVVRPEVFKTNHTFRVQYDWVDYLRKIQESVGYKNIYLDDPTPVKNKMIRINDQAKGFSLNDLDQNERFLSWLSIVAKQQYQAFGTYEDLSLIEVEKSGVGAYFKKLKANLKF